MVSAQRGVQRSSPVSAYPASQSRVWRCAFQGSGSGAAELAQGVCAQSGSLSASSNAARAADTSSRNFQRLLSRWKVKELQKHGLHRIAGIGPRNEQCSPVAGISSVQQQRATLVRNCNGNEDRTHAFSQVTSIDMLCLFCNIRSRALLASTRYVAASRHLHTPQHTISRQCSGLRRERTAYGRGIIPPGYQAMWQA